MLVSSISLLLEFAAIALVTASSAFVLQAIAVIFLPERCFIISSHRPSLAVLVPAHDEQQAIEATVIGIKNDLSPNDALLVVADNCSDQTAMVAKNAGADVLVRNDPVRRGKGFALAAGLQHLAATAPEIVVLIDADCQVSKGGVELLARACAAANAPVQCLDLMMASPDSSAPARLSEFAWRIKNVLRPTGYARLGLPCQLLGTGMAIPWGLIKPSRFATGHLTEDLLLGLELAILGHAARFFRETRVISYFPDTEHGQQQQKQRWIHGHLGLIKSHLPRLLYHGCRQRNPALLALAADLLVPPLGILATANVLLLTFALAWFVVTGTFRPLDLAALASAFFAFCVGTSWYFCGRDLIGISEIKRLPHHLLSVMGSFFSLARGHRTQWIRAQRLDTASQTKRRAR